MYSQTAWNIPWAYSELLSYMRVTAKKEDSRIGPVRAVPGPFLLTVLQPKERVLFDKVRDANPFFHLMETIWMFSGEDEVKWLLQFNKGFGKYAERDGVMRGAYGFRWRYHFHVDQILQIVDMLRKDSTTRRAVIGMWDPSMDLAPGHNDYPCNTHIYFRNRGGSLDMTVCNRSNDLIWGMLGSNAVHMTMLHELISSAAGIPIGNYQVFTNNLHIYESLPKFDDIWGTNTTRDLYSGKGVVYPYPLLAEGEDIRQFFVDCNSFVSGWNSQIRSPFLNKIALPMWNAWQARKGKLTVEDQLTELLPMPENNDWRKACEEWIYRKEIYSSSTLTEPLQMTKNELKSISEAPRGGNGSSTSMLVGATSQSMKSSSSSDSSKSAEENQSGSSLDDQIPF